MSCSGSEKQNRTIHTGDSDRIPVNFRDCAGAPVNVTGATLTYTISRRPDNSALVTRTSPIQVVLADDGESAAVLLAPTHTLYVGRYFHKMVLIDAAGNILTVFSGEISFSREKITSCEALMACVDTEVFVSDPYSFNFSYAINSSNLLFLFDEVF